MALPAPTPATATVDYIPANVRRMTFVPTIANPAAPTTAELAAGTDYTKVLSAYAGFTLSADSVDNSTLGSTFMSTIPGMLSASDSSWTLKASSTSTDARATLTVGTNGYVVIYNEGINTGCKCDVWPVRISSSNVDQVEKSALATLTVEFAIPNPPIQGIAIPTV